jgi:hypothetical protein
MTIKVTYNVTDVYVTQDVSPVYINVSYSTGSGGGSAVWGGITGTLSDQTDLQTALDGKFDDPTGTTTQYIDGTGALQTFPLTLPVLQQVRNQTGGTLAVGTVVYISGATGNLPTVTKAIATGDATSAQTLGMVSAAIANNGTGYVVVIGTCSGLDTSAYTEGQQLYLSYTTAGAVTTTKPYAPYHLVYIGIVTRAHPTLGTVEVRVQNGYELDEIHNVDALNPNNNDGIFYNSTTSLWEHKQISTALGYTPANAATTLTINGVTYDLSTSRTWTISTGISGSGASGQVAYWDGTTSQAGSNNLFWDNANGRLGIGTNAPLVGLDARNRLRVSGTSGIVGAIGANSYGLSVQNNASASWIEILNNGGTSKGVFFGITNDRTPDTFELWNYQGGPIDFYNAAVATTGTRKLRIWNNGNVTIQDGGAYSDGGQRLQVQGTTLLNGNVTFSSATGMTWDATNSRLGIGTNAPSAYGHINQAVSNINDTVHGLRITTNAYNSTGRHLYLENIGGTYFFSMGGLNGAVLTMNSNVGQQWQYSGVTTAQFGTYYDGAEYASNALIARTTSDIPLTVIGKSGQTADLLSIKLHTAGSYLMKLKATGNLLIGSTTDSGERLQVTGTIKVTGNSTFGTIGSGTGMYWDNTNNRLAIGTNTPTKTLVLSKSFGVDDGIVMSDTGGGYFQVTNSSGLGFQPIFQGQGRGNFSSLIFKGLQTATASPTATVTRFISRAGDDSSAVSGVNSFTFENGSSTILALTQNNNLILQNGGTFTDVNSALMQLTSTTKGFLPPRMTTTQKNAISSPAAGLVVYDTTLAKLCVYTTAWETITSA